MQKFLVIIALLLLAVSLVSAQESTPEADDDTTLIYISPATQTCTGVGEQDCLVVRFEDENTLSFFYDSIDGFDYQSGFAYRLRVRITEVENPPADASSLNYELVEIVHQFPALIDDVQWELQLLNGEIVEDPTRYTLLISESELFIGADCNRVQGDLERDPFRIETTISTRVACPEDSLESAYVSALNDVSLMSVENGELLLQTSEGILRFAPPSIEGITYDLTMLMQGDETFNLAEDEFDYTFTLTEDAIQMFVACNTVNNGYEREGSVFVLGMGMSTLVACPDAMLESLILPTFVYSVLENGDIRIEGNVADERFSLTGTPQS
ncbi:MAG: DUF4377 domain-containing protein [Chloroflexota bacterium]